MDRNFTKNSLEKFIKAVDKRVDEYLRRLDESDAEEAATDGSRTKNLAEKIAALREKRGRYEVLLTELEQSGESQISLTDPDSRAMAAHARVAVGYNIQVARRREAQDDRRPGSDQSGRRHGPVDANRRTGPRDPCG
jgi:hypothetical protein